MVYDLGGRAQARLKIVDLQGRTLEERTLESPQGKLSVLLSDLDPGVYLYKVQHQGERLKTGRLVLTD